MTTDDIIRIALEAGAELYADTLLVNGKDAHDFIKRFAALVAAAELRRLHAQAAQDEALLRQVLEVLSRTHQTAMEQAMKARVPECAEFAEIFQDLDFVVAALRERLSKGA